MKSNYKRLGEYIRQIDVRNKDDDRYDLLGVSVEKCFINSIANTVGTDWHNYKIIKKGQFCYIPDTSRRGDKIGIAHLTDREIGLVSAVYTVFEVWKVELVPEYLMLWFKRPEFDRYARFHSHGSVREIFDWEEMCNVELPIPAIEEQKAIVNAYETIERRIALKRKINDNLAAQAYAIYQDWFIDNGEAHGAIECVLADLINILDYKRIPLSSQERAKRAKVYRYFGAAGLLDYVDEYLFDGIYLLVGEDGSVINEKGYPYLQYVDGKFWVNNHAHILQGVGDATTELLYLILLKTNIKEYVTGAVQAKLNQDNLRAIPAIRISKDDMASFNAIIQPIFAAIRNNNLEIDNLQVLKASILTKLTQAN